MRSASPSSTTSTTSTPGRRRRLVPFTVRAAIGAALAVALLFQGPGTASAAVANVTTTNTPTDAGQVLQGNGYAGDCGFTAQMADGNVLWVFCDTLHYTPTFRMIHSAAALARSATPTTLIQPAVPLTFIPLSPADIAKRDQLRLTDPSADVANWPSSIVRIPGDKVLVFYDRALVSIRYGTMTTWGTGIATFQYTPAMMNGTTNLQATTIAEDVFSPTEARFKMAATYSVAGYLYLFANDPANKARLLLARTTPAAVTQRSSYQFWNGTTWVADVAQAADNNGTVYPAVMGGAIVKWLPGLNVYAMSYPPFPSDYTKKTAVRYAAGITGPWSAPQILDLPGCDTVKGCYHSLLHESFLGSGKLVISYYDKTPNVVRAATYPVRLGS